MAPEQKLQRVAARQHGLATRVQLESIGFTRNQIASRVQRQLWRRVAPLVFDVAPCARDPRRALHAAVLSTRGAASHRSAGALQKLVDAVPDRPEVSVREGRLPRGLDIQVHRSRLLLPTELTKVDNIVCTKAARTLLDLGQVIDMSTLAIAVNRAIVARLCSVRQLLRLVDDGPMHGQRGAAPLRATLERFRIDRGACESALESLLDDAVAHSMLPAPRHQHWVQITGERFRLDTAWPDHRVFVEADGLAHHTEEEQFRRDRHRQNRLVAAGWLPLRFTWYDLTRRKRAVIAEIAAVLRGRC